MNLLCPNCEKKLQVPDQYAGQMMKCPLCAGMFTVPALPQTPGGPPPVMTAPPPPSPVPAPAPAATQQGGAFATTPQSAPAPSAPPTGGYQHAFTIWISPDSVRWLAPIALGMVFVLLFLPWVERFGGDLETSYYGWQMVFGSFSSGPGTLYGLLFLPTLVIAILSWILPFLPPGSLPPAMQQLMPWRSGVVALGAFLTGVFLVLQALPLGFGPELLFKGERFYYTFPLRLTIFCHIVSFVGASTEFWLATRGSQTPMPKIDMTW